MKPRLLCVLHRSPPFHGAAIVGDFVGSSQRLQENFECRFITIKSSDTIENIGKVNLKKLFLLVSLYFHVLTALLFFRPDRIYFTASVRGAAFYRDVLISTLWKIYSLFKPVDVFYHYHAKGVDEFVSTSPVKLSLTRFFLKNVNLILLTPMLEKDFETVRTFQNTFFLPNGVENRLDENSFSTLISAKFKDIDTLECLYLSNMIKSKGYFEVLKLANEVKTDNIHFNFAGGWQSAEDEKEFFDYITENGLEDSVTFHGFVHAAQKDALLKKSHLLLFPTRYKAESFGLVIIEAFSFGLPVIATDEGSIPSIIDNGRSGIILQDTDKLPEALQQAEKTLINPETAHYCRKTFLEKYTLKQFEITLVNILNT